MILTDHLEAAEKVDDSSQPSSFTASLPGRTHHLLLTKLQDILERACFRFAQKNMPGLLLSKQWDCSEAVELHTWTYVFGRRLNHFTQRQSKIDKPLPVLLESMTEIRHAAVHRRRLTVVKLEAIIADAESFAQMLDDPESLHSIAVLRPSTAWAIKEVERNKAVLGSKLEEKLREVAARQAEVDAFKEKSMLEITAEDEAFKSVLGSGVEEALRSLEKTTYATPDTGAWSDLSVQNTNAANTSLVATSSDSESLGLIPSI